MGLALGIDLGTSSVKVMLLDREGEVQGLASRSYPLRTPHSGWVETEPRRWWEATVEAVRSCCLESGLDRRGDVVGIGLSGQMHGVVLCDRFGEPVRPAVLWADTRSRESLAAYRVLSPDALRRLGNPVTAGMAGPTLVWLLRHEPERCRRARWALQPKDWLRMQLVEEAYAEPSDASATLLFDLEADVWSQEVADGLGIPRSWLAPLRPSAQAVGRLAVSAAETLGLSEGVPVAAGGGDTACAAFGVGLSEPGQVQVSIGSGMQIVAPREAAVRDPAGRTHLFRSVDGGWYAMAAMQNGGVALEWVRAQLGLDWAGFYAEAFASPAGAEGLTFLPYLTGERTPLMDPDVRGGFFGLHAAHRRRHLARAALEGVAFALRDGLEALEDVGTETVRLRLAGGGTLDPRWRQLLSDVLQRPLDAVQVPAASARGAALLGLLVAGRQLPAPPACEVAAEPQPSAALATAYLRFQQRSREEAEHPTAR